MDYHSGLMNGSEEIVVELALALKNRGHMVGVVGSFHERSVCQNVDIYTQVSTISTGTTLIAFKNKKALEIDGFENRYLWTADCDRLDYKQAEMCDGLFGLGPWHQKELEQVNSVHDGLRISYIEPGIKNIYRKNMHKKPLKCLYASSPDRGLDALLEMWPRIYGAHPGAELHVTYAKQRSWPQFNGVVFHGRVSNDYMQTLYKESDLLLYPCNGGERFCLTALKAQYYGCIPVVIPTMALKDTVQFGVKCTRMNFESEVKRVMGDDKLKDSLRREMFANLRYNTWDVVAQIFERLTLERTPGC